MKMNSVVGGVCHPQPSIHFSAIFDKSTQSCGISNPQRKAKILFLNKSERGTKTQNYKATPNKSNIYGQNEMI
jgi:hypothetical protein